MLDDVLNMAEPIISKVARKYPNISGCDFEDLLQIGRIAVWKIIEKNKVTIDNFKEYCGYIYISLENAYKAEIRKTKAQKRLALSGAFSLDQELSDGDNRNLYDKIAVETQEVTFETLEYIKGIAMNDRDPKAIKGVIYCLVELMNITIQQAPKKIKFQTFTDYGLKYFLWVFFNNSPYLALRSAYPELLPTDMKKVPNNYWKGKIGKKRALKMMQKILENGNYKKSDYPLIMSDNFITSVGLSSPYQKHFGSSPYAFLDAIYPNVYKPWEMSHTPMGIFTANEELAKSAVIWLVEDKLSIGLSKMDKIEVWQKKISKQLTKEVLSDFGLRGLLAIYNNSSERLFRLAYPDKFLPWDFPNKDKWKGENGLELAAEATRWVIEIYAGLNPTSYGIGYRFFVENGLHGMITSRSLGFNSSPKAALSNAYPNMGF